MNREILEEEIRQDEGYVPHPYRDHLGFWTVGVGHALDADENPEDPCWRDEDLLREIFSDDVDTAVQDARRLFGGFEWFTDDRQHVLVGLAFQLGRPRLGRFRRMRAAIDRLDWDTAADELLDSRYSRQTPARAHRYADRLRGQPRP